MICPQCHIENPDNKIFLSLFAICVVPFNKRFIVIKKHVSFWPVTIE